LAAFSVFVKRFPFQSLNIPFIPQAIKNPTMPNTKSTKYLNSGNVIPLNVERGQIGWSMIGADNNTMSGRSEQVNTVRGISSTYACYNCCPDSMTDSAPIPLFYEFDVGQQHSYGFTAEVSNCYRLPGRSQFDGYDWFSSDITVGTIDYYGLATAIDGGTASMTGYFDEVSWTMITPTATCDRQVITVPGTGEMQVRPRVTSIEPSRGLIGNTIRVTINGSGFRSGATVSAGTGISASVISITRSQITADFMIATNATGGNHRVIVSPVRGPASIDSVNFFVQIPTSLVPFNAPNVAPNGIGPLQTPVNGNILGLSGQVLASNVTGVARNYAFTLADQEGQRIFEGFTFDESFSDYCGTDGSLPSTFSSQVPANRILGDINLRAVPYPNELSGYDCFDQTFLVKIGNTTYTLTPKFHIEVGRKDGQLIANRTIIQPGHTH
jgi:hypothetical protein